MNTSYCGKDCEKCRVENDHGCEGCKSGKIFRPGDCKIVDCLSSRGLDNCQGCGNKLSCSMIYNNDKLHRLEKNRYEAMPSVAARGLGKWFNVLFFISLGQLICSVFVSASIIISPIYTIAYFAACFYLYDYSDKFKKSAFTLIIKLIFGINAILAALIRTDDLKFLVFLLFGCMQIVGIISECYKFSGCADIISNSDNGLSEKWKKLIKWNIYAAAGFAVSIVLNIIPVTEQISFLVMIVVLIGTIILSIAEVVLFGMTKEYFTSIDKSAS
ncbi:MAG: DUF3795 domain-containing protein [Ruminococcus sp.]|nr:DUF3795 domain-containing protein [Ruminococcus sp.]